MRHHFPPRLFNGRSCSRCWNRPCPCRQRQAQAQRRSLVTQSLHLGLGQALHGCRGTTESNPSGTAGPAAWPGIGSGFFILSLTLFAGGFDTGTEYGSPQELERPVPPLSHVSLTHAAKRYSVLHSDIPSLLVHQLQSKRSVGP